MENIKNIELSNSKERYLFKHCGLEEIGKIIF